MGVPAGLPASMDNAAGLPAFMDITAGPPCSEDVTGRLLARTRGHCSRPRLHPWMSQQVQPAPVDADPGVAASWSALSAASPDLPASMSPDLPTPVFPVPFPVPAPSGSLQYQLHNPFNCLLQVLFLHVKGVLLHKCLLMIFTMCSL